MDTSYQLILLPGLGADQRQFGPQKSAFPGLTVPPWIAPRRNESLSDYAQRLAETIRPSGPMILGGSSFGGMVACEMARHLRPDALVLIGSCRSAKGIQPALRLPHLLSRYLPWFFLDGAKPFAPLAVGMSSRLSKSDRRLCAEMFRRADSRFMHWACASILHWESAGLDGIPVYQIHGEKDPIIPASRVAADEVVPGAGHLINLTHAEHVDAFISKAMRAVR